jgi:hypothetical protein
MLGTHLPAEMLAILFWYVELASKKSHQNVVSICMRLKFKYRFAVSLVLILLIDSISGGAFATDEVETGGQNSVAMPLVSATATARIVTPLRLNRGKVAASDRSIKLYKRQIPCEGAENDRPRECSISMFEAE